MRLCLRYPSWTGCPDGASAAIIHSRLRERHGGRGTSKGHHSGKRPGRCTAAIYAARAMLEPVLIAGFQPGGQLTITTEVENYPGFAEAIQGPWLMEQMQAQAEHVGTRFVHDTIASVDLARRPFTLVGDSGARYLARRR